MKKLMMALCTLLAVGSGEYAQTSMRGGREVKVSKAPENHVNVPKDMQAKSAKASELAQKKSGSDVVNQNLNIIKNMNGVDKGSAPESSINPYKQTFTLKDGSVMTTEFDSTGAP